uniref:Uncharacterized protein n=1 Tax=Timema douglasi TaxID=61478 RepID=A0A7R8VYQ7_TIMDO|nr:unnamed protein product [Timema douglasi]
MDKRLLPPMDDQGVHICLIHGYISQRHCWLLAIILRETHLSGVLSSADKDGEIENFTVEVFYFPLFIVPATETLFLTPPFSELFPLVDCDLVHVKEQYQLLHRGADASHLTSLSSLELSSLPPELQVPAHHLVSCLHSLLAQWDMREDLYSLGHFSGLLAAQLEALPAANNRRKVSTGQLKVLTTANNRHKVSTGQLEATRR